MSENTAIIPNLSDHRNATFSAGEADNITQLIDAGGFLFGVTLGTPAKAIKINKDDFNDRTAISFANDGKHINAVDCCYSGGAAFVIFNTPDVFVVARVDVAAMTTTDIIDVATSASARPRAIAINDDGTAIFVLLLKTGSSIYGLRRYLLSDLSLIEADISPHTAADGLTYSGGKVFVTAWTIASQWYLLRLISDTMVVDGSAQFTANAFAFHQIRLVATPTQIWVASDQGNGRILHRFNKSSMALLTPAVPIADLGTLVSNDLDLAVDGQYVWELLDNGNAARWDSSVEPPSATLYSIDFTSTASHWQFVGGPAPFIFTTRMLP